MQQDMEKLLARAADAKLIALNEQTVFPLLHSKVEQCLVALCQDFKVGKPVNMANIAIMTVCRDLLMELDAKARHGNKAQDWINQQQGV